MLRPNVDVSSTNFCSSGIFNNEDGLKLERNQFGEISKWASIIRESKVYGDSKLEGLNYSRRETNTMPGWAGSSQYFNRYMDSQNEDEIFSKEAINYWQQVDLYIGGSEHATGHLLYSRFWQKFMFDLGLVPHDEFAKKLSAELENLV